jgi:hypothetical protein
LTEPFVCDWPLVAVWVGECPFNEPETAVFRSEDPVEPFDRGEKPFVFDVEAPPSGRMLLFARRLRLGDGGASSFRVEP